MKSELEFGVYCSSSDRIDESYREAARSLADLMTAASITLVYGGGDVGLMGEIARRVHAGGGRVVGVIPDRLREVEGVAYEIADDLIVTTSMSERKSIIWKRCNAFVVLAGGIGTVEEFMEVITLRKLAYHDCPVVVVNTEGLFDPLIAQIERFHDQGFMRERDRSLFDVVNHPDEIPSLESFRDMFAVSTGSQAVGDTGA